jgi:GNAT superfamily N-acetyltransferase
MIINHPRGRHRLAVFRYNPVMLDLVGPPHGLQARALGADDIPACVAVSAEAGWNQTERDWAIMLKHGSGVGLLDGRLVASAVALPYDPPGPVGFLSMVLVTPAWQRRGLATWLTERCMRALEQRGRTPMLDATPEGQGVYRKLGFAAGIALDRWRAERVAPRGAIERVPVPADIALYPVNDLEAVVSRDARAFGAARGPVLRDLLARRRDLAWAAYRGAALAGFVLGRDGRTATDVGPLIADDEAITAALLAEALRHVEGPAVVDLLRGHDRLATMLAATGFAPVRAFTRMHRGDAPPTVGVFAAIGPEFG